MLKDLTYGMVSARLKTHIKTCKYAPSISELRGKAGEKRNSFNNFHRRHYDMEQLAVSYTHLGFINRDTVVDGYGTSIADSRPSDWSVKNVSLCGSC